MSGVFSHFDWNGMSAFLLRIVAVFLCITVHEVCHGFAARLLGDPTAERAHRLSFNPIRHIDPMGLLMMVLVGFGWAKPVPVNPGYFKDPKSGMAITAFAGPLSNFVLAFVAAFGWQAAQAVQSASGSTAGLRLLINLLSMIITLSIGLGLFNLIPIPPLDGAKILGALLPENLYFKLMQYERYGMFLLFALLFFGVFDGPLRTGLLAMVNFILSSTSFFQSVVYSILT